MAIKSDRPNSVQRWTLNHAFFPGVPDLWYSIGQKELFTQKEKTKTNKMKKVKKKAMYVQCGMRV